MFKKIQSLLKIFTKLAAKDVPTWMPEWVHKHKDIEQKELLSDVKKKIPVGEFEENLSISVGKLDEIRNIIDDAIVRLNDAYSMTQVFEVNIPCEEYIKLLNMIKSVRFDDIKIMDPVKISYDDGSFKKTVSFQPGTTLIKILQNIQDRINKVSEGFIDFSEQVNRLIILNNKKDSGSEVGKNIRFTTSPREILGMSSRSDWTSCQNLFDVGTHKEDAIHSALNKYTGMIYLTTGEDYLGRGDKIIARSLVFYIVNFLDGKEALILPKVYPQNLNTISWFNFFKAFLEKHTDLPIMWGGNESSYYNYFLPIHDSKKPYLDVELKTTELSEDEDINLNDIPKADIPYYKSFIEAVESGDYDFSSFIDAPNLSKKTNSLIKEYCEQSELFKRHSFYSKVDREIVMYLIGQYNTDPFVKKIYEINKLSKRNSIDESVLNFLLRNKNIVDDFYYLLTCHHSEQLFRKKIFNMLTESDGARNISLLRDMVKDEDKLDALKKASFLTLFSGSNKNYFNLFESEFIKFLSGKINVDELYEVLKDSDNLKEFAQSIKKYKFYLQ